MGTILYMDTTDLNDKNFISYAMRHYNNPQCSGIEEFNEDLQIPIHLKKLFTRYSINGVLKERLIANHIVCFMNVVDGTTSGISILLYSLGEHHWRFLKTFLVSLGRCPAKLRMVIKGKLVNFDDIPIDEELLSKIELGIRKSN